MKLIYERAGESARMLEPLDVPALRPADGMARKTELKLPRVAESEMSRHYAKLGRAAFGVCDGFYPLGSCTMKYNPKVNEPWPRCRLYGRASHAGRARLRARAGAGKGIPDRDHRHGRHDV